MSLVMPILMGSKADRWREVAEGDIEFARDLADEGIKFDTIFRERLLEGKVAGCMPRPSRIRGLDPVDRRWLGLYCLKVCIPWHQTWAEILSACDRIWVPRWCKAGNEDLAVEHIGLGRYFETLTAAISTAAILNGSPKENGRSRPRLPAKSRASFVLQGRYMGYMRQLRPRQKALVRKIREAKGVRAAVQRARELARS